MKRSLLFALAITALALAGPAPKTKPKVLADDLIRMTVQPMAAPVPGLKYQLLPELREMSSGNPIEEFLKCLADESDFFQGHAANMDRNKWLDMPLAELRKEHLGHYGGAILDGADAAARLDRPDWQCLTQAVRDGMHTPTAPASAMRTIMYPLRVRLRAEIAEGRFDDAIRTLKTNVAMSRDLGEYPGIVGILIGVANVDYSAIDPLEEMIQQPGCPNLYWALTSLPSPLIDLRLGLQSDRIRFEGALAVLDEKAPMSDAKLRDAIEAVAKIKEGFIDSRVPRPQNKAVSEWLDAHVKEDAIVTSARKRLMEWGLEPGRVKAFPSKQVLLLDQRFAYDASFDAISKLLLLPYREAAPWIDRLRRDGGNNSESLLPDPTEGLTVTRIAQSRVDQRIGMLRCAEAVRLYAADNEGKFPARLSDVGVPVPIDPFTGAAFVYSSDGTRATISAAQWPYRNQEAVFCRVYEMTVRK